MCFVTFVSVANSSSREELTLIEATRFSQSCYAEQIQPKHRSGDEKATPDPGLLRIIARAHDIRERLVQNTDLTVDIIAQQERVSANYVYRLLRLPCLAPDIITAIVNGKNPPQLTADAADPANTGRLGGTAKAAWLP